MSLRDKKEYIKESNQIVKNLFNFDISYNLILDLFEIKINTNNCFILPYVISGDIYKNLLNKDIKFILEYDQTDIKYTIDLNNISIDQLSYIISNIENI